MIQTNINYKNQDIQMQIWNSLSKLEYDQQLKLLDLINTLFLNVEDKHNNLLKYSGYIEKDELDLFKASIKDCEKIDYNEW